MAPFGEACKFLIFSLAEESHTQIFWPVKLKNERRDEVIKNYAEWINTVQFQKLRRVFWRFKYVSVGKKQRSEIVVS